MIYWSNLEEEALKQSYLYSEKQLRKELKFWEKQARTIKESRDEYISYCRDLGIEPNSESMNTNKEQNREANEWITMLQKALSYK